VVRPAGLVVTICLLFKKQEARPHFHHHPASHSQSYTHILSLTEHKYFLQGQRRDGPDCKFCCSELTSLEETFEFSIKIYSFTHQELSPEVERNPLVLLIFLSLLFL